MEADGDPGVCGPCTGHTKDRNRLAGDTGGTLLWHPFPYPKRYSTTCILSVVQNRRETLSSPFIFVVDIIFYDFAKGDMSSFSNPQGNFVWT